VELVKRDNWYKNLILDLKQLACTKIVEIKHAIGKRILEDFEKFGNPAYGSKRVENIAKDLNISVGELKRCIRFANKYPTLAHDVSQFSWHHIANKLLPEPKKEPEIKAFPLGKYQIIYADPAWKYYQGGYKNQEQHYETLDINYIIKFIDENKRHVKDLADENCILFLWTTSPMLPYMIELIKEWGFKYSTVGFVWVKSLKDGNNFHFGCGNWTRANCEYCLIGIKGKIERKDASISQIIYEPISKHSKKPAIVREKIVKLVGNLPRIELFARNKRPGWDFWGNEIE